MSALVFLFLSPYTGPQFSSHAACPAPATGGLYRVAHVYDGDSIKLGDGTKVRLAGINTPELRHGKGVDEPFASAAKVRLSQIVQTANHRVHLQPAVDSRDKYGRMLAHAYTPAGHSLQEKILLSGLGLAHIHPPNLTNRDCYRAAEARARMLKRGVWNHLPVPASSLDEDDTGFIVLVGRVAGLHNTRRSVWLRLEAGPSLRIARSDLTRFKDFELDALTGADIEARGWLHRHRSRLQVRIRHSDALHVIDGSGAPHKAEKAE